MPAHPKEETEHTEGITEKVAKDPSSNTDSTASSHPAHENEHTPGSGKASAQDHQSKGPVIPQSKDDMPPKASREEIERKKKELNQE